ncbi:MAG: hypothetical protein A3F10_04200 [Coxiella sp. RIFCSPHIGHO2_12_FULL_42_15]|nr:MAG: hypothetical protein A3F10_04200 [Coxiella sp. RIFCSPHIGHO2_12_FULL_42_15]
MRKPDSENFLRMVRGILRFFYCLCALFILMKNYLLGCCFLTILVLTSFILNKKPGFPYKIYLYLFSRINNFFYHVLIFLIFYFFITPFCVLFAFFREKKIAKRKESHWKKSALNHDWKSLS